MRKILYFIIIILILPRITNAITWTTLNFPDAAATAICGIDGENIAGYHIGPDDTGAFLYDGTTWTEINMAGKLTNIEGISGDNILGQYVLSPYSFIYNWGNNTSYDIPISGADFYGIDGSYVVGGYQGHGIIYNLDTLQMTTLDYPGATETTLYGIDGENIVGRCSLATGYFNFLYDGTTWTILGYIGSIGWVTDISGRNIVTNLGLYNIDNSTFTPLSFPDSRLTNIYGIDGDTICGQYIANGKHGFIATIPEPGTMLLVIFGAVLIRKR